MHQGIASHLVVLCRLLPPEIEVGDIWYLFLLSCAPYNLAVFMCGTMTQTKCKLRIPIKSYNRTD